MGPKARFARIQQRSPAILPMVPRPTQRRGRQLVPGLARTRQATHTITHLPFPRTDSACLPHQASAHRDRLFHLLNAAASARQAASVQATHDNRDRSWGRFLEFLDHIGLDNDPFLDSFTRWQRNILISAFAQFLREKLFSPSDNRGSQTSDGKPLGAGTIASALSDLAQAFRAANRPDPRLDEDLKTCFLIQQQQRGYKNQDPNMTQQKALPIAVLRHMDSTQISQKGQAISKLCIGAIFFAMRSCEYTKTSMLEESKRTKILRLRNLRFFRHGREVPHSSPFLAQADYISITFEFQKNDERSESVGMHRTDDPTICPVKAWASTAHRILSYPGTDADSKVNLLTPAKDSSHVSEISSTSVRNALRVSVKAMGKETLGFSHEEIGTHSLRSGAAMAMHLAKVPTFTIMIIGRWSSDAFLRYIRKQVEGFSSNISSLMLQNENFFTTPNVLPQTSDLDTRRPNDPTNFATLQNGRRLTNHLGSFAITI